MNLKALVNEPAVKDNSLSELFDQEDMARLMTDPNDVKEEIAIQLKRPELNLKFHRPVVLRDDSEGVPTGLEGVDEVVFQARDAMNRGATVTEIAASLRQDFPAVVLAAAQPFLKKQFALEGLVGVLAVDSRGYPNCKAAVAAAKKSPRFASIRYVLGCSCGTPHMLPVDDSNMVATETKLGQIDQFFASEDAYKENLKAHCHGTMLRIFAREDLDDEELDPTYISLVGEFSPPEKVTASLAGKSRVGKIMGLCKWARRRAERVANEKYLGHIDASQHQMAAGEMEIGLHTIPSTPKVTFAGERSSMFNKGVAAAVKRANERVTADKSRMGLTNGEVELQPVEQQKVDEVELCSPEYGVFAGSDEIQLNPKVEPEAPLKVEPRGELAV